MGDVGGYWKDEYEETRSELSNCRLELKLARKDAEELRGRVKDITASWQGAVNEMYEARKRAKSAEADRDALKKALIAWTVFDEHECEICDDGGPCERRIALLKEAQNITAPILSVKESKCNCPPDGMCEVCTPSGWRGSSPVKERKA